MAVVPNAALVINYPRIGGGGGGFGGFQPPANLSETLTANERRVEEIRKMLRDAEAYGRAQDAYAKDKSLPRPDRNVVLEPLVPYVRGEQPVIFRADREAEIRGAIRFAEEMKLKPIILGGNDAWKVATLLKEKNVPVILTGIFSLPSREDDAYDALYEQPAKLQQAGVRYCHFHWRRRRGSPKFGAVRRHGRGLWAFEGRRDQGRHALSCSNHERGRPIGVDRGGQDGESCRHRRRFARNSHPHTIFVHRWPPGGVNQ